MIKNFYNPSKNSRRHIEFNDTSLCMQINVFSASPSVYSFVGRLRATALLSLEENSVRMNFPATFCHTLVETTNINIFINWIPSNQQASCQETSTNLFFFVSRPLAFHFRNELLFIS